DRTVRVWDTATGQEVFSLAKQAAGPGSVAFSPDGRLLAVAGSAQATLYDAAGKEVLSFTGHGKEVTAVAFSADGQRVASIGADATVRFWEAASGKEQRQLSLRLQLPIIQLAFMADGQRLILTDRDGGL